MLLSMLVLQPRSCMIPQPDSSAEEDKVRIAFDGDAVVFDEESEAIYKQRGLEAFFENERDNADKPLPKVLSLSC